MKTDSGSSQSPRRKFVLGTRGSPLALAQAQRVKDTCEHYFGGIKCEIRIIKTSGDKLQTASLAHQTEGAAPMLEKGLFTKELESALMDGSIDMAIHSLKDLPVDLPESLVLAGVLRRADVRDVLIYRSEKLAKDLQAKMTEWIPGTPGFTGFKKNLSLRSLSQGATVATSSTRRQVQIHHLRPDIQLIPIRGNVGTRMSKLRLHPEIDATLLAAAGLERLGFHLFPDGHFNAPPACRSDVAGILGSPLGLEEMLPCVGQAAIGVEIRREDEQTAEVCKAISNPATFVCVTAERAFLRAMGGGCQSPVAAYSKIEGHRLHIEAVSFRGESPQRTALTGQLNEAEALGRKAAETIS